MGTKICLILSLLLISNIVFAPTEVMARAMLRKLQAAEKEDLKFDADASIHYKPLEPGPARTVPPGKPYTRPCTYKNGCKPPGTPRPHP